MIRHLALAAALAGCVAAKTDHLDGTVDDPVSISARWTLTNLSGRTMDCPPGFTDAVLVAQAVDDSDAPTAAKTEDRFACDDGVGSGRALPEHVYQAWIEIRSTDDRIYAKSVPQTFNLAKLDQPMAVTILNDAGYAQLAWQLVATSSGHAADCGALASPSAITVHGVSLDDPHASFDEDFVCEADRAVTHAARPGTYSFTVSAHAAGATVGSSAAVTATIADHNAVSDLGTITIPITSNPAIAPSP